MSWKSRQEGDLVLQEIQVRGGGLKNDPICQGGVDFFWNNPRTRNAVVTQAVGEHFHSFSEFSQTFMSVSITLFLFRKHRDDKRGTTSSL